MKEIALALKPARVTGRAFHVTAVFHKNKLVGIGHNNYNKTHPLINKYNYIGKEDDDYRPKIHSELAAWLRLGDEDCSKYTFFNLRVNKNNKFGMSRPCSGCRHLLKQIGFKKFFFTDEKGEFKEYS